MNRSSSRRAGTNATALGLILAAALFAMAAPTLAATPITTVKDASGNVVYAIDADGGFVAYGAIGSGAIPATGSGTRFMWYPGKAAFRGGGVGGNGWDDGAVSDYSFAFGFDARATANYSTASGRNTTASGDFSTASGDNSTASRDFSTVSGSDNRASGDFSTVSGRNNEASASFSTVSGSDNIASGDYSTVSGINNRASAIFSTVSGINNIASGDFSTVSGRNNIASGDFSTAMGLGTIALRANSLAIGQYNDPSDHTPIGSPNDAVFTIGNGLNNTNRSNALMVEYGGNVQAAGLFISNSDRRLKTDIQPLGDVLPKLAGLTAVHYRFKPDTGHSLNPQLGLIAQDVQKAFPEVVSEGGNGYLSVAYGRLSAVLVKAVQEQQDQLQDQAAQLRTQQQQIDELRAQIAALTSHSGP